MAQYLYEALKAYSEGGSYPFHMPGHKRRMGCFADPFAIDITEIEGFDNLHHAEGILLEAQRRAARLYGAQETYYLVNGSTAGILAAISACTRRRDRILMARNCHKSAYHAVFLNGLHVSWLYPRTDLTRGIHGSVDPGEVLRALDREPDIAAVVLTSPTYDGVVSDIRSIAAAAHERGAVLIVDEAHGAHFAMHPYFPESAVACGADLVVNSLHKTMPSLTQTALLHVSGPRVDRERVRQYLGIYQSSSPSYVLMAGMDSCIHLMEERREKLFDGFCGRLERTRACLSGLERLHLVTGDESELPCYAYDRSRIVISTEDSPVGGRGLCRILRERYQLEPEMAAEHYVTALTSVADTEEGFARLCRALQETDAAICRESRCGDKGAGRREAAAGPSAWEPNEEAMSLEEAENCAKRPVELCASAGLISGEYVYLYPPGIPLLIPGEVITQRLVDRLLEFRAQGFCLQGLRDFSGGRILVAEP